MKTAQPDDLNLLREWREPIPRWRIITAVAGVILYHMIAFTAFVAAVNAPGGRILSETSFDFHRAVPLYIPKDLTQRDPNRGKISHDLDVRSAAPPAPVPQAPRVRSPEPGPLPVPAIPAPIEPPKVDAVVAAFPPAPASPGSLPAVAPPPVEKPKLTFESVGAGGTAARTGVNPNVKLPQIASTLEEALRAPAPAQAPQPSPGGGVVIGDLDDLANVPNSNQAPSSGPIRSNLQLLSDAEGVDFKPYLVQVLTAVRVNWFHTATLQ